MRIFDKHPAVQKCLRVCSALTIAAFTLISCDHEIISETVVHPDGSLDKTFIFQSTDSAKSHNLFGVHEANGWSRTSARVPFPVQSSDHASGDSVQTNTASGESSGQSKISPRKKYGIQYTRTFNSAEEVNKELNIPSDTLLQIRTSFEKSFRWFYTYITYSESYQPINKMKFPLTNYLTREDSSFIARLPAEGHLMSKADSLQFESLREKLFDKYGTEAIKHAFMEIMKQIMDEQGLSPAWNDTLARHIDRIFARMQAQNDIGDDYLPKAMDTLGIPLDTATSNARFRVLSKAFERRLTFISDAYDGKYQNTIEMPGEVVRSNADSVAGNRLFWRPSSMKFLVMEYTLQAESRALNPWAIIVSLAFLLLTVLLFLRKRP